MLRAAMRSYLRVRRALGVDLVGAEHMLDSYCAFAEKRGDVHVRKDTTLTWSALSTSRKQRFVRLGTVVRFARYLVAEDPRHELPPADAFGRDPRRRGVPFIFSRSEIGRLVQEAARLGPSGSYRSCLYVTLFGLIAVTGLRVSEALNLRLQDVTADGLTVRWSKFRKSRLVPLHATAVTALHSFLKLRRRRATSQDQLFVQCNGRRLKHHNAYIPFQSVVARLDLPSGRSTRPPRLHDLRHSFAVNALERYAGSKMSRHMVALSTYLGHGSVRATYWYLEATPQLMRSIAVKNARLISEGEAQ